MDPTRRLGGRTCQTSPPASNDPGFDAPSGLRAPNHPLPLRTRLARFPGRAAAESNETVLLFALDRSSSLSPVDRPRSRSLVLRSAHTATFACQLMRSCRSERFRRLRRSPCHSPPPRLANSLRLCAPARLLSSSFVPYAIALPHCRRSFDERPPTRI